MDLLWSESRLGCGCAAGARIVVFALLPPVSNTPRAMDTSPTYHLTIEASHSVPSTPPTVIDRFRRSLSHRSYFSPKSTLPVDSTKDQSTSRNLSSPPILERSTQETKRQKATPFERFLKLGRKKDDKSTPFPPPHWLEQEAESQALPMELNEGTFVISWHGI